MDNHVNSKKEMNYNVKDVLSIFLFIAAFLIIWQIVFSLEIWPRVSLPSPAMVGQSFIDLISENILIDGIAITLWRLFIGFNDFGILFVIVMNSVFSVMNSTYGGIRNIPPIYLHAARNMGASGILLFRYVMIPASAPSLIMGLRQTWSFAWHALIGAEMLITTGLGLGYILAIGREFSNMSQIIATMIVIFGVGLLFDRFVFSKVEEKVREKWGLSSS